MTNPYTPPEHGEIAPVTASPKPGVAAPLIGCGVGGCLVPLLLLVACGVFLGDTGGPLIWPILAVPLGITGFVAGLFCRKK